MNSARRFDATTAFYAHCGRVFDAGRDVETVTRLQLEVDGARVEGDAALSAEKDLVVGVRMPAVGVPGAVAPPVRGQTFLCEAPLQLLWRRGRPVVASPCCVYREISFSNSGK